MKVLIISGSYPSLKCGVGIYTEKLFENLRRRGVDASVLTSRDPAVKKDGPIHALIERWGMASLFKILSFIRAEDPDLVNLQAPTLKYKAILNAVSILPLLSKIYFKAKPFILTVHDFAISRVLSKIFFLPIFLFSDRIVVTNGEDEEDIVRRFPFLKRKVRKIYMGPFLEAASVPDDKKRALYRELNHKTGHRFIVTLGFIKRDRCIDTVIRVFHRLKHDDPDLKLIIVGDAQRDHDAGYRELLLDLTEELGLADSVCWTGFCEPDDAAFYLSISTMAILLYERGASLRRSSLINVMTKKIPVITNIAGKRGMDKELLSLNGLMTVDSIDITAICEKAKIILYDDSYAGEIRQKMEGMDRMFNWDRHIDGIVKLYSDAIAN